MIDLSLVFQYASVIPLSSEPWYAKRHIIKVMPPPRGDPQSDLLPDELETGCHRAAMGGLKGVEVSSSRSLLCTYAFFWSCVLMSFQFLVVCWLCVAITFFRWNRLLVKTYQSILSSSHFASHLHWLSVSTSCSCLRCFPLLLKAFASARGRPRICRAGGMLRMLRNEKKKRFGADRTKIIIQRQKLFDSVKV